MLPRTSTTPRRPRPTIALRSRRRRIAAALTIALLAAGGATAVTSTRTVEAVDFVVDTFSDDPADGDTLREAVIVANAHPGQDRIAFSATLGPGTVTLQSPLVISDDLELTGGGVIGVTNPTGDSFALTAGADFTAIGVTIERSGRAAIATPNPSDAAGDMTLVDVTITGSGEAAVDVTLDGNARIDDSTITGNEGGVTIHAPAAVEVTSTTIGDNGHGLRVDGARDIVTLTNLTADDNDGDNAVLDEIERSIVITDSSFASSRSGSGLVIGTIDDDVVLTGVSVVGNAIGGATIGELSGSATITDSWFDTSAAGNGLTIHQADDAILTNLRATGNAHTGIEVGDVFGATIIGRTVAIGNETGIVLDDAGGFVSITDSTSADASGAGVGVSNSFATTQIERSTISGNDGPAITSTAVGSIHVMTSTLTGNATSGTAVVEQSDPGSTLSIRHATVVDNGATANSAPLFASPAGTVDHSIVAGNDAAGLGPVSFTHSILPVGSSAGPTNIEHSDPVVGPLADHGGPTLTMLPMPGSAAIDAGDAGAASPGPTDQRGQPRITGITLDIGAVEVGPHDAVTSTTPPPATSTSPETSTSAPEPTTTTGTETSTSAPGPSTSDTPTTTASNPTSTVDATPTSVPASTAPADTAPSATTSAPTTPPTTAPTTAPPTTPEDPSDGDGPGSTPTTPPRASNTPPIIQPILARTISAGMETVLPVTLRDADGDPVWLRATANDRSVLEIISISRLTPSGGNALFDHRYEVLVRGRTEGSAVITVVADDGQATASGSSVVVVVEATLPATGSNAPRNLLVIASVLSVAGLAALSTTRRRRHA